MLRQPKQRLSQRHYCSPKTLKNILVEYNGPLFLTCPQKSCLLTTEIIPDSFIFGFINGKEQKLTSK